MLHLICFVFFFFFFFLYVFFPPYFLFILPTFFVYLSLHLFVFVLNQLKAAYTKLNNHTINGVVICVQYVHDLDVPKATKSLCANRSSTKYRSGLIVQSMQNGVERMISIIPNCKPVAMGMKSGKKRKKSEQIKTRRSKMRGKKQRHKEVAKVSQILYIFVGTVP